MRATHYIVIDRSQGLGRACENFARKQNCTQSFVSSPANAITSGPRANPTARSASGGGGSTAATGRHISAPVTHLQVSLARAHTHTHLLAYTRKSPSRVVWRISAAARELDRPFPLDLGVAFPLVVASHCEVCWHAI